MRLPTIARRDALSFALASSLLTAFPNRPAFAADGVATNFGETAEELEGAMGGLKPGTGRPLNALIKMRAETGIDRVGDGSPLFKPGQILDQLRTEDGGEAQITFAYPEKWTLAGGPNLDVRDVKESDSAFVLAAPLPSKYKSVETLPDDFVLSVLLSPQGKFGQYGQCDDRKIVKSDIEAYSTPTGGKQMYKKLSLKFAPLTYNGNTVERRALISATSVGGTCFILVAGSLATRYKKLLPELEEVQTSFRAIASRAVAARAEGA